MPRICGVCLVSPPSLTRRYVVIGNGIAGQTCAEELRKLDAEASIVMIAAEKHPLYNRVALPRYLRGQVRREKVFMRTVEDYAKQNLEIHLETWVTEIDAAGKVVHTNRGQSFTYDALLIATGGRPKPPPWPGSDQVTKCLGFQTIDDTDSIIQKADADGADHVTIAVPRGHPAADDLSACGYDFVNADDKAGVYGLKL